MLPAEITARYPTFEHEGIALICGDCLEILPMLPAGSVDAVVTDPPYGIGESSVKNSTRSKIVSVKNYGDYFWDKKLDRKYIDLLLQSSKNQILFGGNYYADWLPPFA